MAQLTAVRLDEATWGSVPPGRRHEWRVALDEILETHVFAIQGAPPRFALDVTFADAAVELVARTPDGETLAKASLARADLAAHFQEYLDICRKMGKLGGNPHAPQLEAFDIAKRIAHDEAAETVARLCGALAPDHATARRIFTLLVTLYFDTTRLVLPHHRQ